MKIVLDHLPVVFVIVTIQVTLQMRTAAKAQVIYFFETQSRVFLSISSWPEAFVSVGEQVKFF